MDNQPKKPVAVVTGVGPGLGASLVRRFAATYAVAMLARRADYLKALARELRQGGATVLDLSCDVSDRTQITDAFRAIRKDLGEPDVLLYNAGSGAFGAITEITPDQYEADWRVNAFGAFVAAKEVAPAMIARGRGTMLFNGRPQGRAEVDLIWTREVRDARLGAITRARPWSERHPRRVDQRGWQHRHPWSAWIEAASARRRLSQARRDRRDLLASRAPGSERVDYGTRSPSVQGEILIALEISAQTASLECALL
jgi:hypothetical protein